MAVPRYGQPQVRQEPLPQMRAPEPGGLAAYGGGEGAAQVFGEARGLTQDAGKMAKEAYQQGVSMQFAELQAKLSAEETRQKFELSKVKGKDALGESDKAAENFDKFYGDLDKNAGNRDVRDRLRMAYLQHKNSLYGWAKPYEEEQMRHYGNENDKAVIQNEQSAVEQDASKERVLLSIMRQGAAVEQLGKRNGMGDEWIKGKQTELESETHSRVLNLMLASGNDMQAKQYFTANEGLFTGSDLEQAKKAVEQGSYRGESQRIVDRIGSTYYTEETKDGETVITPHYAPETLDGWREEGRKASGDDPTLRDHVMQRIEHEWTLRKESERQEHSKILQDAANLIEGGKALVDVPQDLFLKLTTLERRALLARQRQIAAGEEPVTNWERWAELRGWAMNEETRDRFARINPMDYRNDLSNSEFKEIVGLRDGILRKDEVTLSRLKGYRTVHEIVGQTLKDMSLGGEDAAKLKKLLDERYEAYALKHKEAPKNGEVQSWLDEMLKSERHWYTLWMSRSFSFERTDEEQEKALGAIPPAERAIIEETLQRKGFFPTRTLILQSHQDMQKQVKPGGP